jgi:hypothetical protein
MQKNLLFQVNLMIFSLSTYQKKKNLMIFSLSYSKLSPTHKTFALAVSTFFEPTTLQQAIQYPH